MHHHISSPAQKTDVRQISPRQHSSCKKDGWHGGSFNQMEFCADWRWSHLLGIRIYVIICWHRERSERNHKRTHWNFDAKWVRKRFTLISHWKKLVHQPVNLNVPINLIDSWHNLPCTVCGSVSYKKTKQDKKKKKKKKIIIREACLDERIWQDVWQVTVMRCQKRVAGGVRGWNFATGTKEDLCLLLWQHDSQLRRQYEATRRDELLVQDCSYIFFLLPPSIS